MKAIKSAAIGLSILALALGAPGLAMADLVTNGGFETNGGNGQIGYNTSATGWYIDPSAGSSYTFLFNPQSMTTSGTSADNSGANGQYGSLALWGPGNGSANGLTLSPNGGAFIAQDGAFQQAAIQQTITGLTVGDTYAVSFSWAAAQQLNFSGATYSEWTVSLGTGPGQSTGYANIANHGFSGWMQQTFNYTATSTSEVLSFFADGGPFNPSLPPFALLDGVSMTDISSVPEPSTLWVMGFGLAGLAGFKMHRQHRRKAAAI